MRLGTGHTLIRPAPPGNKPIAPSTSQSIKVKALPIAPNQPVSTFIDFDFFSKIKIENLFIFFLLL